MQPPTGSWSDSTSGLISHNRKDSVLVRVQHTLHRDARRTISLTLPHLERFTGVWAFEFALNLYLRTDTVGVKLAQKQRVQSKYLDKCVLEPHVLFLSSMSAEEVGAQKLTPGSSRDARSPTAPPFKASWMTIREREGSRRFYWHHR